MAEFAFATCKRFGCVPFEGEGTRVGRVVIITIVVGELRQTEVSDFNTVIVGHENVSSGKIAVYDFFLLKVLHSLENSK